MVVTIMTREGFSLRTKTYVDETIVPNNTDLEIVKWQESEKYGKTCYTVADFNDKGEICSCGDRLLKSMTSKEEVEALRLLSGIATAIICYSERVPAYSQAVNE